MVAADVGLQVRPQEGRVPAEVGAHGRLGRAAPRERLEQPAQRPRAQGRDIGRPRGAGARRHWPAATTAAAARNGLAAVERRGAPAAVDHRGGPPGRVQPGEGSPGLVAVTVRCQRPGPVPVVQVVAPQQRRAGLRPVEFGRAAARGAQPAGVAEQGQRPVEQFGHVRPGRGAAAVERYEGGRPAADLRGGQPQQPVGRPGETPGEGPLAAQAHPGGDLLWPQVPHGPRVPCGRRRPAGGAGHSRDPVARRRAWAGHVKRLRHVSGAPRPAAPPRPGCPARTAVARSRGRRPRR